MQRRLEPAWSDDEVEAGRRKSETWRQFFSEAPPTVGQIGRTVNNDSARIANVRRRHEQAFLRYPNVVGVASGIRVRGGAPTGDHCLVVYVTRKLPPAQLDASDVLPTEIDGVPVDVVETGPIEAL